MSNIAGLHAVPAALLELENLTNALANIDISQIFITTWMGTPNVLAKKLKELE